MLRNYRKGHMPKGRYFTKSRFVLALECPTKLYYSQNKEYANRKLDDPFLKALAHGGFQVGALAQKYYPEGKVITELNVENAIASTNNHLENEKVVLFEPAINHENLLVRVDIFKKNGNFIELIEVKAKSFDPNGPDPFFDKRALKAGYNKIVSKWKRYLYDVAFQKYVTQLVFPEATITCKLMLADKSKVATIEGLNQKFLISKDDNGRSKIEYSGTDDLGEKILAEVNVDHEVNLILDGNDLGKHSRDELGIPSFSDDVKNWASAYSENRKIETQISSTCKNCEFKATDKSDSMLSGFDECWNLADGEEPITNIWNFRKTDKLLEQGVQAVSGIHEEDIEPEEDGKPGISAKQRQWMQIQKSQSRDDEPFVDIDGLSQEMACWEYPLNFIDFETSMVALPFNKGRRPYEQIAFQFSHHILHQDGRVEHANEYINKKRGYFPNYDFVRELKKALETNSGSIFRYSNHENTVLLQIYDQLANSSEPDKEELQAWIGSVTKKKSGSKVVWEGPRNMIDQWEIVKRYYYHPRTKGSNSIKYVLPAVLFESERLKQKYSQPIYGVKGSIKSYNFDNWTWLRIDDLGNIFDPYKLLDPLFNGFEKEQLDNLIFEGDGINDGGAAATGYAAIQFSQMLPIERSRILKSLLKYCELDTLAMVMLTEHWLELTEGEYVRLTTKNR